MDDRAMADYKELIRLTPKNFGYYGRLADFLVGQDQPKLAMELYNQAFEFNPNPNDAGIYESRGIAYLHLGNADKALEDFNKAEELNPKDWRSYNNRAW